MNKRRGCALAAGFLAVITALLVFLVGIKLGEANARREAVEANVARWIVVDASGNTKFEWIVCGESK